MSCFGDGKCMKLCNNPNWCLINFDHELSNLSFCKTDCENECQLIPCKNTLHCESAYPYYFFKEGKYIKNDMCNQCNIFKITFLREKRRCLVCSDVKYMIVTNCQHEMCYDCLFELDEEHTNCPFCGTEIEVNMIPN
jgi:hypothetical protein